MEPILAIPQNVPETRRRLDQAEGILSQPVELFLADVQDRDLVSFYFFLGVQACLDLAACRLAEADAEIPSEPGPLLTQLVSRGVVDMELAERMRTAAALWRQIAYNYDDLDHAEAYPVFREGIITVRLFLTAVAAEAGL